NTILESSDTLLASGQIEAVGSGLEVDVDDLVFELDEPITVLGNYYLLVVLDPGEQIEETNEDNNIGISNGIVVTDQPIPELDIVPVEFDFEPLTTFLDGSLTMNATVLNQGEESTPNGFFCRVHLSDDNDFDPSEDTQLDTFNFPSLGPDEELDQTRVTLVPGFFSPGFYYVFMECDPTDQISEADEDNNVIQAPGRLEISADPIVDLRLQSFEVSPRNADDGQLVTITAEICNDGTNGAGPSRLRVWLSQDNTLEQTDPILLDYLVEGVDADTCETVVQQAAAACDNFQPDYTVFAKVDATDLLPELDEDNNTALLDTNLTIAGPFCDCVEDALEQDNNSPATPTFVRDTTYENLTTCSNPVDWYALALRRGETARVTITFDNDRGNLDMTLYDASLSGPIDRSLGNGDTEEVVAFVVDQDGDYRFQVEGKTDLDRNVYNMTVEITPPVSGTDLIVTDVEISNPVPVLGETVEVDFSIINLGDVAAGANTARIYMSQDIDIDPGIDILLAQVPITGVPAATLIKRTIEVSMPLGVEGGDRYIGVVADALNDVPGELDETNNVGLSDIFFLEAGCFDLLEPNNSRTGAKTIALTQSQTELLDLLVCSDNRDFYTFCADAGDFLRMTANFDDAQGDIDLRLYSAGGTQLARAEGTGDSESLEVDYVSVAQCYTLEVLVVGSGREVAYELVVENGPAPAELVCSGSAEPNNGFGTAAILMDNLDPIDDDLAICPVSDVDYYRVDLSAGTQLVISLVPGEGEDTVPADLRMSLWSSSQSFLANTVSATEPLIYTVTSGGRHYLRVTSLASGVRNQRYQFDIQGLSGVDIAVSDYSLEPSVADPGERIQYAFTLANNRIDDINGNFYYGIYLSEDLIIDGSDLLLKEVLVNGLDGGESLNVVSKVTIPENTAQDQTLYLAVVADNRSQINEFAESNNRAVLPLTVRPSCVFDSAEPNDLRQDAADFDNYADQPLFLCADDTDWFVFDADPSTQYMIEATFVAEQGDLDLFAYSASGVLLGEGVETGDNEAVIFITPAGTGTAPVYIEVAPFGDTRIEYQLSR
ncbi:MAG: hypothetical protein KC561_02895, partial [Myxococcales bacterium]|nr:hypothetical protein [Myxococcales bacterium]